MRKKCRAWCFLALVVSLSALAENETGQVGGRLVLRQGSEAVPLRRAQEALKAPIGLELRQGATVVTAKLDPDGYFVASGPPGRYRFEYLDVGERAEFFLPRELEIRGGQLVCAGTFDVKVPVIEALGANSGSSLEIADDCAQALPRLRRLASAPGGEAVVLASAAPTVEHAEGRSFTQYLLGLRLEGSYASTITALRGTYVYPLHGDLGDSGSWLVMVSGGRAWTAAPAITEEVSVGGGYTLFDWLELTAFAGYRLTGGPVVGASGRLGISIGGIGFRGELSPGLSGFAASITLDIAPFFLVGACL
jgi:hypothetical protein